MDAELCICCLLSLCSDLSAVVMGLFDYDSCYYPKYPHMSVSLTLNYLPKHPQNRGVERIMGVGILLFCVSCQSPSSHPTIISMG